MSELFDVIATLIKPPHTQRVLEAGKTERNAEAIVNMAVMRRGVSEEFYSVVPAGSVK